MNPVPTPPEVVPPRSSGDEHGVHEVTELLHAWGAGDAEACEALARLVYDELRRQARRALRREGDGHTLQATALVHEAWLRLDRQSAGGGGRGKGKGMSWESRTQFFAVAAQMMRRILVDRARDRHALKRGGRGAAVQVSLGTLDREGDAAAPNVVGTRSPLDPIDLLALDDALERLALLDPRKARLVELRYFAGLSIPEAAVALDISAATVGREWAVARMWLRRELGA
jgi:RNA polymerase sigma factor (TIGR02999 family)